ncbi:conserved membrane hypothetical protein [Candidatus Desulfarcum epimagneticum]|uniref:EamA domain-containing protein n=1 Tax=uncultured Desulfobacteraceae bacterium TaxID=218296 RepID=A0A484HLX3_9BACT|nr:conserved membrane hypothetical protein [uncultured Desulfobacteraceae bacterium]
MWYASIKNKRYNTVDRIFYDAVRVLLNMKDSAFRSDILLLITAAIWGFGFVAQRAGMPHMGPMAFSAIRFTMGAIFLVPFVFFERRRRVRKEPHSRPMDLGMGMALGAVLFMGVTFQQVGLVYTTAGKAAFITGLYVVMIPIAGLFFGVRAGAGTWVGGLLAGFGLYFLSVNEDFSIATGDLLELAGAFFWAAHVMLVDRFLRNVPPIRLSFIQFSFCAVLSAAAALFLEDTTLDGVMSAAVPLLYGGFCSVGVAYTLQVVAQQNARPAHAAIILCLEAVFAAVGGWLVLGEELTSRAMAGCLLMLSGMIFSQLTPLVLSGAFNRTRGSRNGRKN